MEETDPLQFHDNQVELAGVFPSSDNPNNTSKRQRRPSVRLGEIGDQPAATVFQEANRRSKQWKPTAGRDQTKIRQLAQLSGGGSYQQDETLDLAEGDNRVLNLDDVAIGSWKSKRVAKKPRTSWNMKANNGEEDSRSFRGDDEEETDEQLGLEGGQLRRSHHSSSRVRVEDEERDLNGEDEDDLDGPLDQRDGVKNWLEGLGLRRYWPVFEIHEVDEEVLPLLTLDDLKDMGINAVGSRRKMFGAIQKLRKGFS